MEEGELIAQKSVYAAMYVTRLYFANLNLLQST